MEFGNYIGFAAEENADTSLSLEIQQLGLRLIEISKSGIGVRTAKEMSTLNLVKSLIKERQIREKFVATDLLGEPAWDMLLWLYLSRIDGVPLMVTSLCSTAGVPATTAMRYIQHLENEGLLVREQDKFDGRRVYLRLSDEGARSMSDYLAALSK